MQRAKKFDLKTEGQRLLRGLRLVHTDIARALKCGATIVGYWHTGRSLPGVEKRHQMELLYGIPLRAWDVPPGTPLQRQQMSTPQPESQSLPAKQGSTLAITKEQIAAVLDDLKEENIAEATLGKLRDTLAKLLALRARLERDHEMLEDRAVRGHPEWRRIKKAVLSALEPHPEAMMAVIESLKN